MDTDFGTFLEYTYRIIFSGLAKPNFICTLHFGNPCQITLKNQQANLPSYKEHK